MPEQYFFLHRSPMPGEDGQGAIELITNSNQSTPYKDAPDLENSIYYYWWLFLRESEKYKKCCENLGDFDDPVSALYPFFGDIFRMDFQKWWMRIGRELFCESQEPLITVVTPSNYNTLASDVFRNKIVQIKYSANEERLLAELKYLIQTLTAYRNTAQASDALFPVSDRFHLPSLHKTYSIYKAKHAASKRSHFEVGVYLGMWTDAEKATPRYGQCKQEISRQLAEAKKIIQNVEMGVFPARKLYGEADLGLERLKIGMFAANRRREYLCSLLRTGRRLNDIHRILTWAPNFAHDYKTYNETKAYDPSMKDRLLDYLLTALPDC